MNLSLMDISSIPSYAWAFLSWKLLRKQLVFLNCLNLKIRAKLVFYAGMDKVKFKKQVVPGDQLVMTAKFVKRRGTIAVVEAKAEVDGKLAASGTLTFAIGS